MAYDLSSIDLIQCRSCGYTSDDLDEFGNDSTKSSGKVYECKECGRNRRKIREMVNYKLIEEAYNVPCKRCGVRYPPCVMDLHHRNPKEKQFVVSQMLSYSETKIKKEISKCDVYCSNCHRIIHYEERRE